MNFEVELEVTYEPSSSPCTCYHPFEPNSSSNITGYAHVLVVLLYHFYSGFRQSCKILKRETATAHANFKRLGCAVAF